jgi:tetratricopeptide (TPR) repeat protein
MLFVCGALLAVLGCPNVTPEKSVREWMVDGRTHCAEARWDDAVADFTEVLRQAPQTREALVLRAHASVNIGDADQALEDCEAALKLQPNDMDLLRFRANIYRKRGEYDTAEKLDREANKLVLSSSPDRLHRRGRHELNVGHYPSASRYFERELKLEPHNAEYLNDVAWLAAACPEGEFRNGTRAVELALEACQLTQWGDCRLLDTLAAAYAETGQFDKAVRMQLKATDLAPPEQQENYRRRSRMYQEGKPYRMVNGE